MSELWIIELLGGLSARFGEERITRFATQKTASLLAYLAFYRRQSHLRETLVEMLWPEVETAQGRSRLSTLLSYLRSMLEPPGVAAGTVILADRNTVRFNSDILTTDTALFEQRCRSAANATTDRERLERLRIAIDTYRGELLPGFYEDWVGQERAQCCERYVEALYARSRLLEKSRMPADAVETMDIALKVDAYREDFYRVKMRCLAAMGRADAALTVYEDLNRVLREELSAAPSAVTCRLAEQIRLNPQSLAMDPVESEAISDTGPPNTIENLAETSPRPANSESRLPVQLTRLIGREDEVLRLTGWLETGTRLITLTGTGGTGKTRLAIEGASRARPHFAGRVWFVDLSRITDPRLIPFAVAQGMQVSPAPNADPLEQVIASLTEGRCLLLLDNFEHLLCAKVSKDENPVGSLSVGIVRLLLERAPELTCLITSRQPLHLGGEQEYPVAVLAVPEPNLRLEQLLSNSSIALYMDRARAVRPDFALSLNNCEAVASLCRKLEGMPLAIEMAAAWAKTLTPARMLEHLQSHINVLTSRRRDLPPRHQSMRAAVEWSFDHLDTEQQRIFARLSVFRGGWTVEDAGKVCNDEADMLAALSELQERSLVVGEESMGDIRFRFLETLREFAALKLAEMEEQDACALHHLEVFLALAEEARPYLTGEQQGVWLVRLEREHDNFRCALQTCLQSDQTVKSGLALVGLLSRFWVMRGYIQEGRKWVTVLLNHPAAQDDSIERAAALHGAGNIAVMQSDFDTAHLYYQEGFQIARSRDALHLVCLNLLGLGKVAQEQGRFAMACSWYEEVIGFCRQGGFLSSEAVAENNLGTIAARLADYVTARACYERSLKIRRELGDTWGIANTLRNLGYTARGLGDTNSARQYHEEGLRIQRQLNNPSGIGYSLHGLGTVALAQGDYDCAQTCFAEGLEIKIKLGEKQGIAFFLECFASLAQQRGAINPAIRLHVAAETLLDQIGYTRADKEAASLRTDLKKARDAAGDKVYEQEYAAGKGLSVDEAISLARDQVENCLSPA